MKHGHRFLVSGLVVVALAVALALLASGGQGALAVDGIIYVDADATGGNNGSSWDDAYTDLQPAMEVAGAGDEIWVAAGTYKPTAQHGGGAADRLRRVFHRDILLHSLGPGRAGHQPHQNNGQCPALIQLRTCVGARIILDTV